jgi:peptidoglycan/LPS O-acetylase OafA/YrhL
VTRMMKLVRFVLLLVIATLMVSTVVVGLGTADTGPVEKVVLVAFGGLLILAALKVHKLGTAQQRRSKA